MYVDGDSDQWPYRVTHCCRSEINAHKLEYRSIQWHTLSRRWTQWHKIHKQHSTAV